MKRFNNICTILMIPLILFSCQNNEDTEILNSFEEEDINVKSKGFHTFWYTPYVYTMKLHMYNVNISAFRGIFIHSGNIHSMKSFVFLFVKKSLQILISETKL